MSKMKILSLLIIAALATSCGINGEQKATITQSGSSYTYVVVRLEYLQEIKDLCTEANPVSKFADVELQHSAIAQCTLENMKLFNISVDDVTKFANEYCNETLPDEVTPEQQEDIITACNAITP